MLISVDLPAPFSPKTTCTSPRRRSKSTPLRATTPGNRFTTPSSASTTSAPVSVSIGLNRRTPRGPAPTALGVAPALRLGNRRLEAPVGGEHRLEVGRRERRRIDERGLQVVVLACSWAADELHLWPDAPVAAQ